MYFEFETQPHRGATWTPMIDVCEREDRNRHLCGNAGR